MSALLGLLDVHPRTERVSVGRSADGEEQFLDVTGISGEDIWNLLNRFPTLFADMMQAGANPGKMHPEVLGAVISAATRSYGNEEAEKIARTLPVGTQMKVLRAMGRTTFPDGFGPFLEDLKSASGAMAEAVEVVIRERATTLQQPQKPSAPPETPSSGSSPPDK